MNKFGKRYAAQYYKNTHFPLTILYLEVRDCEKSILIKLLVCNYKMLNKPFQNLLEHIFL